MLIFLLFYLGINCDVSIHAMQCANSERYLLNGKKNNAELTSMNTPTAMPHSASQQIYIFMPSRQLNIRGH